MNLKNKKQLASRTLGVGAGRIAFRNERVDEIKEAITKQDIRDLVEAGAIVIKEIKGKRKKIRGKRRGFGKIKKKVQHRKRDYMILTRKLRSYLNELRKQKRVTTEEYYKIRKQIRAKIFRNKAHFKELMQIK